ncbi:MAG: TonB-dependent receptor [Acidobacteria bacterium]|nr:TonB-dependent receptor [Acidobacteriota bacterium]
MAVLLLFCGIVAHAQTSTLSGDVSDPSGARVTNAQVTITNVNTGIRTNVVSDSHGEFNVPALQPGRYNVRAEAPGFSAAEKTNVRLEVDTAARVSLSLTTGEVNSTVTVSADPPLLQPNNGEIETHISETEYEQLPLLQLGRNRNPTTFVYLTPGVQGSVQLNGGEYIGATNVISVYGSQQYTTELLMEGFPGGQSRISGNFTESSPPPDAIGEFKMTTTGLPAQYGHTGAAVGSFSIKSGTNQLHGSVYEYLRNGALDAGNWLAKHKGNTATSPIKQNEFGATIGGPVYIPGIYNGHDRTFFFFSYGGSRRRGLDTFVQSQVPTLDERNGIFPAARKIYDPATTSGSTRTQFSGNQIPTGRFDPVAVATLKYIPEPNQTGTLNYGGYTGNPLLDPNLYTTKINHKLTLKQDLSALYIRTIVPRTTVSNALPGPAGTTSYQVVASHTIRMIHNWTFTPNFLNSFYFGFNRFTNLNLALDTSENYPNQIGFPGSSTYFPVFSFSNGYTTLNNTPNGSNIENDFYFKDQAIWQYKRHTITFGGEYRKFQYNDQSPYKFKGSYAFNSLETADPSSTSSTGDGFASFLLGQVHSGTISQPVRTHGRQSYYGFFVQDDWRIHPRLTLNMGLRYEWQPPWAEAQDHQSAIGLDVPNPATGNLPGALISAGRGPIGIGSRHLFPGDHSSIGPRVGFAFSATPQTILRGAYGIYYSDPYYNGYSSVVAMGYQVNGDFLSTDNGLHPAFVLRDGVPNTYPTEPTLTPTAVNGQNVSYYQPNMAQMPRTQSWNLSIQQQITPRSSIEFVYVGTHNTRQIDQNLVNINQVDPKYLAYIPAKPPSGPTPPNPLLQKATPTSMAAVGATMPYPSFNGTVVQALRPYPQYLTMTSVAAKAGASIYHGGQVIYQTRTNWGLMFHAGYTWSKSMGYASPTLAGTSAVNNVLQNAFDPQAEWAELPQSVRHSLVMYWTYELPFGKGRKYLMHGVGSVIAGGWNLSAIQTYQSGTPLQIVTSNTLPIFNSVLRPNKAPGVDPSIHMSNGKCDGTINCVFNASAFSDPDRTFGNADLTYSDVRNFAVLSENLTLAKETPIGEHLRWSLYAQALNTFNRHRFYAIQTNSSNASFGVPSSVTLPRQIQLGTRFQF